MSFDYTIFIHRLYFNGQPKKGGLDFIIDYLLARGKKVLMVEFPLDYKQSKTMVVTAYNGNKSTLLLAQNLPTRISFINWIFEFFLFISMVFRFKAVSGTIITSDPLSTLPAVLLRKTRMYDFHYYHSIDYSTDRFGNKVLNFIYNSLLKIGLKNADLVGVVTLKAKERLEPLGVKKIFYIPNSPDYEYFGKFRVSIEKRRSYSVVLTCSEISPKYKIIETIKLISKLKSEFPTASLDIVGNVDESNAYVKSVRDLLIETELQTTIRFHGAVDRDSNYKIISGCSIGIALYDADKYNHIRYGDSLKIREYVALGLPVVADDATPTAFELKHEGAGFMIVTEEEAYEKIKELFANSGLYRQMSEKALFWAKKMDKRKLLKELVDENFK